MVRKYRFFCLFFLFSIAPFSNGNYVAHIHFEEHTDRSYNISGQYGRFVLSSNDIVFATLYQDGIKKSECTNENDSHNTCILFGDRVWFGMSYNYSIQITGVKIHQSTYITKSSTLYDGLYYDIIDAPILAHDSNTSEIYVEIICTWYANLFSIYMILLLIVCPLLLIFCCATYFGFIMYGKEENIKGSENIDEHVVDLKNHV